MNVEHYQKNFFRLSVFYGLFGACFLVLIGGLFFRQVVQYNDFKKQEKQQSIRCILQPGTRGFIVDRNGEVLVGNRPVWNAVLYLNELRPAFKAEYKRLVKEAKALGQKIDTKALRQQSRNTVVMRYYDQLNILLGTQLTLDSDSLRRHFEQRLLLPYPIFTDLSPEQYAKVIEHCGIQHPIQIFTDSVRCYPHGALAAHVLGYVGTGLEGDMPSFLSQNLKTFALKRKIGRSGLEKTFDSELQGAAGETLWLVDPSGFQCEKIEEIAPQQGKTLVTSLDLATQKAAEDALGPLTGAVVAIDIETGEILALCSHPTYNLNDLTPSISKEVYEKINQDGAWLNRAHQGLYPPGSPFKLITALAGLRNGFAPSDWTIDCTGGTRVGNRLFPCMKLSGHGPLQLEGAIAKSCNPYFYELALQVGPEKLAEESRRYGLGELTGIELPYETHRTLVPTPAWKKTHKKESWTAGDTANTSIGQGFLLVTPLQMGAFAASLARGECRTQVTLLHNPKALRQKTTPLGIPEEAHTRLLNGMELTSISGTGRRIQIPGLKIAAKTGTAQVTVKGEPMELAWCLTFAPLDNPKVAVVVVVEEVDSSERFQGGLTATPIAKKVLEAGLKPYLKP
jgi:penicillin-binding protein 2